MQGRMGAPPHLKCSGCKTPAEYGGASCVVGLLLRCSRKWLRHNACWRLKCVSVSEGGPQEKKITVDNSFPVNIRSHKGNQIPFLLRQHEKKEVSNNKGKILSNSEFLNSDPGVMSGNELFCITGLTEAGKGLPYFGSCFLTKTALS